MTDLSNEEKQKMEKERQALWAKGKIRTPDDPEFWDPPTDWVQIMRTAVEDRKKRQKRKAETEKGFSKAIPNHNEVKSLRTGEKSCIGTA